MLPRASKSSKLVGLLDALDALDEMDVATDVATAESGRGLGSGASRALGFGGEPNIRRHAGTEAGGRCEHLPDTHHPIELAGNKLGLARGPRPGAPRTLRFRPGSPTPTAVRDATSVVRRPGDYFRGPRGRPAAVAVAADGRPVQEAARGRRPLSTPAKPLRSCKHWAGSRACNRRISGGGSCRDEALLRSRRATSAIDDWRGPVIATR